MVTRTARLAKQWAHSKLGLLLSPKKKTAMQHLVCSTNRYGQSVEHPAQKRGALGCERRLGLRTLCSPIPERLLPSGKQVNNQVWDLEAQIKYFIKSQRAAMKQQKI